MDKRKLVFLVSAILLMLALIYIRIETHGVPEPLADPYEELADIVGYLLSSG